MRRKGLLLMPAVGVTLLAAVAAALLWPSGETRAPLGRTLGVSVQSAGTQASEPLAVDLAAAMEVPTAQITNATLNGSDVRGVAVWSGALGSPQFPTVGQTFTVLST